jgi:hypothetical protein
MPEVAPTLILEVPASAVPDMTERLTAFLLHHQYEFVQTFNPGDAQHTIVEIFPAQAQPGVRLTLQATESGTSTSLLPTPADITVAPPETVALFQRLLEVLLNTSSGNIQPTEGKS